MNAPLAPLAQRFRFNENVLRLATANFTQGQWDAAAGGKGGNTARWLLGHIAASRRQMVRKLGEDLPEEPWEDFFSPGSRPRDPADYPAPAALVEVVQDCGKRLSARLGSLDSASLDQPWGAAFPDGSKTIGEGLNFLFFHECYHLGQLGLLRRIHGLPGFA